MKKTVPVKYSNCFDSASMATIEDVTQVSDQIREAARLAKVTDSNDTLVFARQLETVKNRTYEVQYAQLKGRQHVPVSYDAGPNAKILTYRVYDGVTVARLVADDATDFESVTASARELYLQFHKIGLEYNYTIDQLRDAAFANVPLDMMLARRARDGIEMGIDEAIAFGVPTVKTFGLTNHPNVSLFSFPTGNWGSASGELILADLNALVTQMLNANYEMYVGDTLLMSTECKRLITTKLLNSAAGSMTVLQAFQAQNPGITVDSWTRLNDANATGDNGRIVFYKKDPQVLEFEMGYDFEILPEERKGLTLTHICRAKFAGVSVHLPFAMLYADNQLK